MTYPRSTGNWIADGDYDRFLESLTDRDEDAQDETETNEQEDDE